MIRYTAVWRSQLQVGIQDNEAASGFESAADSFCVSDLMAIGAIRSAMEENLRIPRDLAFAGLTIYIFQACLNLPLQLFRSQCNDLGCTAMDVD